VGCHVAFELSPLFTVNLSAGEQNGDRSACPVGFTKAEHLWQQGVNRKQKTKQNTIKLTAERK
jgi:hypothetical protein